MQEIFKILIEKEIEEIKNKMKKQIVAISDKYPKLKKFIKFRNNERINKLLS